MSPLENYDGSLAQCTYFSLRDAILSLRFRPGELLRKAEVCESLGVSRFPVAEAIAKLASEGLVHVVPQAGTFIARFSIEVIREGAFLREALELAAVEAVAPVISDAQIAQLNRSLARQSELFEAGDFTAYYTADNDMHEMIMGFTGFHRLNLIAGSTLGHLDRARRLMLPVEGRVAVSLAGHREIVAALEARCPKTARSAMRRHLRELLAALLPLEQERPDLFAGRVV